MNFCFPKREVIAPFPNDCCPSMVYICSPFSGDTEGNTLKARRYSRYAVDHGVIPIAPHLLLPQFMREETERDLAMFMDIAILSKCKELWVFGEPTAGMQEEIAYAQRKKMTIKYFDEEKITDDKNGWRLDKYNV